MATEQYDLDRSYKAGSDLSTKQFYLVKLTGTDQIDLCSGAGDVPIGVLQNKPKLGEAATVRHDGVTKIVTDGTANGGIAVGSWVGTSAAGKGIKKSADKDYALGLALDASSADGVIIRVFIRDTYIAV